MNLGHGRGADWYTVGILLYELTVGRPPFMSNDPYEIFKKILREPIPFDDDYDIDAKSLINHLTEHDQSKRYGTQPGGVKTIKNHRYLEQVDFIDLKSMNCSKVPYIPDKKETEIMIAKIF